MIAKLERLFGLWNLVLGVIVQIFEEIKFECHLPFRGQKFHFTLQVKSRKGPKHSSPTGHVLWKELLEEVILNI